jgi:hypothetical protein
MGRNAPFPQTGGNVVQQPPIPAKKSAMRSGRSQWSLMSRALGVSGAGLLPGFRRVRKEAAGDPSAICASSRAARRKSRQASNTGKEFSFFFLLWVARERTNSLVRRHKREVFFTPELHPVYRHSLHPVSEAIHPRNQCAAVAEKIEIRAAEVSDEAGATPPFDAPCVTGSVGSLAPHQFSECTRRLSKSTGGSSFLNSHLRADTVTGARRTRVTVAVTNAVTSDGCKTARDTEVMNRIGRGENPGMGWSDPVFWPKACSQKTTRVAPAHQTLCVNVLSPRPRVGTI